MTEAGTPFFNVFFLFLACVSIVYVCENQRKRHVSFCIFIRARICGVYLKVIIVVDCLVERTSRDALRFIVGLLRIERIDHYLFRTLDFRSAEWTALAFRVLMNGE